MRHLPRTHPWLLVVGVLAAIALLATGCRDQGAAGNSAGDTPGSASPSPVQTRSGIAARAGGEGLDVRYLDPDGKIKTLRVEDLPR